MTPGRRYTPEDIAKIVWRRKWLLLVPLVIGAAAMVVYARTLPNIYQSQALIQVVPQRIPESVVRPTVTGQLNTRLTAIAQQILSRARLESLIVELNLYPEVRKAGTMQDAVERMPRDVIGPTVVSAGSRAGGQRQPQSAAFVVGFSAENPRTAMRVAERLASMFIEENLRQRTGQVDVTDQFLESQLTNARAQLEQHEKRLEEFRRRNAASLPTQLGANTSGLQGAQQQIANLVEKNVQDRERRMMLERQIADLASLDISTTASQAASLRGQTSASGASRPMQRGARSGGSTRGSQSAGARPAARGDAPADAGTATATLSAAERLELARNALIALEVRLKPDHPDIGIANRHIAELEKLAEQEALSAPLAGTTAGLSPAEVKQQQQLKALRDELEMLDRQIARKEGEEKALREKATMYQARIEETPTRETELAALNRDYETLQGQYGTLLKKQADSKIASELEHRQVAEQFSIVEPPREPPRPSSPNRPWMVLMGALSGLALGLVVAGGLEYRDGSFRTDADVTAALSLPVLALIPAMVTAFDRRQRLRQRLLFAGSTGMVVLVSLAEWKFRVLTRWLP